MYLKKCLILRKRNTGIMETVVIDILNTKVVRLLQDLEFLQLIRVRKDKTPIETQVNWLAKYKGSMSKQPVADIDNQLSELRGAWE